VTDGGSEAESSDESESGGEEKDQNTQSNVDDDDDEAEWEKFQRKVNKYVLFKCGKNLEFTYIFLEISDEKKSLKARVVFHTLFIARFSLMINK